ncbi:hypothetical protein [Hyphomonas sp.]|uniref:hypothetical protein n=1 Tax=Hyphomonas sp. TaxID=87 RepID=UPI0025B94976|nr:hypothetical protein [Hyphomonas sp.]MBI1401466.1 hypothetical protein [Hyphomonas sp.]
MFDFIRNHAAKAFAAAFALGNVSGCALLPGVMPGAKTVDAVSEVCLADRHPEETAFCFIGTYAAVVDALATEREAGTLDPKIEAAADVAINATAERVAVASELWGAVAGYRTEVEALEPLAKTCIETVSDQSKLSECLAAVGYLTATGELKRLTEQAKADWSTLKPKVEAVIGLDPSAG